jgi:hypothetical protein
VGKAIPVEERRTFSVSALAKSELQISEGRSYHDQNAMKNPRYEKKKTLPYLSTGLKTGMDFAFFEIGLISGALQSCLSSNPMLLIWGRKCG